MLPQKVCRPEACAPQLIKVFICMVTSLSFLFSRILDPIYAGTVQPNPITKGIKDFP